MASIFFTESLPALQILQMTDVGGATDTAGRRGALFWYDPRMRPWPWCASAGTMVAMWFVDDLSNAGRMARRLKSDADQLPESDGVFHVGPAAFCGTHGCINRQYAHFSVSLAFCFDRAKSVLLAFEALKGAR
jgi:hypothetical protein